MKKILVIFLSLLTISCFSQKHFRKGYILQGDTLHGMVQYREGNAALDKCTFQKEGQPEATTYSSGDLDGYGFEGRHFRSIKTHGRPLFAEVTIDGKAKLLREGSLYLVQKDTVIVPLSTVTEQAFINGRQYTKENKTYALRLKSIFSDCPGLPPAYEKMELWELTPYQVEKKFSDIVSQYNACFGATSTAYKIPKSKPSLTWGVEIGAVNTTYAVDTPDRYLNSTDFNSPIVFTGGLFVDYTYPRISEKIHARLEVTYLKTKITGTYTTISPVTENHIKLQYNAIKIPISLAYNFSTGNFSPYLRGGANLFLLSQQQFTRTKHYPPPSTIGDSETDLPDLTSSGVSFFAGLGAECRFAQKHFLFAEFRYESKMDVLNGQLHTSVRIGSLNLTAGLRF